MQAKCVCSSYCHCAIRLFVVAMDRLDGLPSVRCPITQEIMVDPVILVPTGHSYERTAIEHWMRSSCRCPKTNIRLRNPELVSNHALRNAIEESLDTASGAGHKLEDLWEIDAHRVIFKTLICQGSQAEVWQAELQSRNNTTVRPVAVKKLFGSHMVGPQWELLQNELRIMQRASSKCDNVVRLLGSCIKDGSLCLVMKQYAMNLKELAALHPQCQLPHHQLLRIGVDVCKGMEDLHREGIVVLDLKPQNLLWDQHHAVIADFGISHKLETTFGHLQPSQLRGSPNYTSPEGWDPEQYGGVTPKADVWSFGCTVLELATGEAPWAGLTMMQILCKVVNKAEQPDVPPSLDQPLAQCIRRCFAHSPENRPAFSHLHKQFVAMVTSFEDQQEQGVAMRQQELEEQLQETKQQLQVAMDRAQVAQQTLTTVHASSEERAEELRRALEITQSRLDAVTQILTTFTSAPAMLSGGDNEEERNGRWGMSWASTGAVRAQASPGGLFVDSASDAMDDELDELDEDVSPNSLPLYGRDGSRPFAQTPNRGGGGAEGHPDCPPVGNTAVISVGLRQAAAQLEEPVQAMEQVAAAPEPWSHHQDLLSPEEDILPSPFPGHTLSSGIPGAEDSVTTGVMCTTLWRAVLDPPVSDGPAGAAPVDGSYRLD